MGSIPQYICGEYHLPQGHSDAKLLELVKTGKFDSFETAKKELGLVPMMDGEKTRRFVTTSYPQGRYTFVPLPYVNHTADMCCATFPSGSNCGTGSGQSYSDLQPIVIRIQGIKAHAATAQASASLQY